MTQTHTLDSATTALAPDLTATSAPITPGGFTHSEMTTATAERVRASTARIRTWTAGLTTRVLAIGAELDRVKILLPHGQFGPWLAAEFGWSERTAQRYMQANEVFGAKSDTVSVLEPTSLYQLSAKSTPEAVRTAILTRLEAGEHLAPTEIKAEVAAARKAAGAAKLLQAQVRRAWVAEAAVPTPAVTKAHRAAALVLEHLGEHRTALRALLEGVDVKALVDALMAVDKNVLETRSLDI